jgi:polyphenol oxidase
VTQRLSKVKDLPVFRLRALEALDGLACGWVGRGPIARPDPAGLVPCIVPADPPPLATVAQVHSNRWLEVASPPAVAHAVMGEADALVTARPGVALGIATADCVPIVAVDPVARALAVVHAGWRGTRAGILRETLAALVRVAGARAERVVVGAGPAVGPCCYEVGEEVAAAFEQARPRGHAGVVRRRHGTVFLDLIEENRLQAADEGVSPDRVHAVGVCTVCRADVCHSFRRDGPPAGRMWLLAALI